MLSNAPPSRPALRRAGGLWTAVFVANGLTFALVLLGGLAYAAQASSLTSGFVIWLGSVVLLGVFVWTVWSWKVLTGSLFDPYVLFLTAAYLFNGGQTFLQIFGLNQQGILHGLFPDETVLQTIFLIILGFLGFHAGGLLSLLFFRKRGSREGAQVTDPATTGQFTRLVGWVLLAASIVPAALSVKNNLSLSLSAGYMAIFTQETSHGYGATGSILASFLVPGVIFLVAGSKDLRFNVWLATAAVVAYCVALFLTGQRGTATMLLIAYAWVYHRCVRPISGWFLLAGGGLLLLVVFPVVSVLRSSSTGAQRLSLENFVSTFASINNPLVASLSEMGYSMTTVAYTVALIPSSRPFDWGVDYLYGLFGIFPNLFWAVHPSLAHGTPALWLLATVAPSATLQGAWGLGYSFIAEAYFNFGWFGAPVTLGVFGLFLGWFTRWAETSKNVAKFAAVGSFAAFVLIFTRGEFLSTFGRPLVWYSLIPYWIVLFLQVFSRDVASRQPDVRPPGKV